MELHIYYVMSEWLKIWGRLMDGQVDADEEAAFPSGYQPLTSSAVSEVQGCLSQAAMFQWLDCHFLDVSSRRTDFSPLGIGKSDPLHLLHCWEDCMKSY